MADLFDGVVLVPCPRRSCGAQVRERCRTAEGLRMPRPHAARVEAAKELREGQGR